MTNEISIGTNSLKREMTTNHDMNSCQMQSKHMVHAQDNKPLVFAAISTTYRTCTQWGLYKELWKTVICRSSHLEGIKETTTTT